MTSSGYKYVIVIARLIFDTMHTLHETRGREAPEGECNVCIVSNINRAITIISPPPAVLDALLLDLAGLSKEDELGLVLFLFM